MRFPSSLLAISASQRAAVEKCLLCRRLVQSCVCHSLAWSQRSHYLLLLRGLSLRTINKAVARGSLVINGTFVGDAVMHPGFAAKPFLRPALDRKAEDAVNAVGKYIAGRLNMGDLRAPVLTAVEDDE